MFPSVNAHGYFGSFGGRFVPETLMSALLQLERDWQSALADAAFQEELRELLHNYVGRPTALTHAQRLSAACGGGAIYLKREDLNHTGAHKINNALGQALLAKRSGRHRLIAETGAGQHGVASATAAALLGLECDVYMGRVDIERQRPNVRRMELLGARIVPVDSGAATLKDAVNEAIRDWVTHVASTHYIIGSAVGPHPYPTIVRDLQRVIGVEARAQMLERCGRLPHTVVACVGGGSNAIGIFHPFLDDPVQLIGVEAAGAAPLSHGDAGVLHGAHSFLLQDDDGQIGETTSISAGLDYPGVGPEHAALQESGRVQYTTVNDAEALDAFHRLCKSEGIVPALETAHAIAAACRIAPKLNADEPLLINLSGRGDKDLEAIQ